MNAVSTLWIGESLNLFARLMIKAHLDHEIPIHLYTYDAVEGIPNGCIVKDASDVIPWEQIRLRKDATAASDWWRFRFLSERGGIWSDADLVPLRKYALPEDRSLFIRGRVRGAGEVSICPGFISCPKPGDPIISALAAYYDDPATIFPWDDAETLSRKKQLAVFALDERQYALSGQVYNRPFIGAKEYYDYDYEIHPASLMFPIPATQFQKVTDGSISLEDLGESWAVHLCNSQIPEHTLKAGNHILRQLLDRHMPEYLSERSMS